MKPRAAAHKVLLDAQRVGVGHALNALWRKTVNALLPWKVLHGMTISQTDAAFMKCPDGYSGKFLSPAVIREFAKDPAYEMSESFLFEAFAKGDECFAICHGDTLAAYGWYSLKPTRIDPPGLVVEVNDDYVYMYKGFTHAHYRGQRLYAVAITLALHSYLARGFKGLVSYVESHNLESLKSCQRIGYVPFGKAYVGKMFGRYFRRCSRGCAELGFRVRLAPPDGVDGLSRGERPPDLAGVG